MNNIISVSPCMAQAYNRWLKHLSHEKRAAHNTYLAYSADVQRALAFFSTYLGEELSLASYSNLPLQAWRALLTERLNKGANHLSNKRALSAYKNFDEYAKKAFNTSCSSLYKVTSPKTQKKLPRPLQMDKALETLNINMHQEEWLNLRDQALFTLLYGAGLRINEALQLNGNVLPMGGEIKVMGKGSKERFVPVLPEVKEAVTRYVQACPFAFHNDSPLFFSATGLRLYPQAASKAMRFMRVALGLPETATPHALRHSFASHLLASSQNLRAIQKLLGHASLSSTQVYLDIEMETLRDTLQHLHPRNRN